MATERTTVLYFRLTDARILNDHPDLQWIVTAHRNAVRAVRNYDDVWAPEWNALRRRSQFLEKVYKNWVNHYYKVMY